MKYYFRLCACVLESVIDLDVIMIKKSQSLAEMLENVLKICYTAIA
jgi:hypothetical protein